jgi:hypothetical protein
VIALPLGGCQSLLNLGGITMRPMIAAALLAATGPLAVSPAFAHQAPAAAPAGKPVPKDQLLKPPANADHYVVVSDAGKHGDQWRWRLPDARIAYRWSQELRGWISEVDQVVTLG